MKKSIKYLLVSFVAALGCVFTSCNDEDTDMSRIVLASADVLEYETLPGGPQIITITSDADWVSEAPEWITVSPASGNAGQTEVEIMVNDNLRENLPDNPRRGNVLFKGRNLESIATVIIRQEGDKFRDPVDYTIEAMEAAADETVVRLPNMIVTAVTGNGFIATDGTDYVYVKEPAITVTAGMKVSVVGEKFTDEMRMAYVLGERMTDEGTATIPSVAPVDITETLDQTNGNKYQYVSVTGNYDGNSVTVGGMTCKVYLIDPADALNLSSFRSHRIAVTGYFAGQATPVVNIIPCSIEDFGVNETVYFEEDFEWLEPWSALKPAADIVGSDQKNTEQPQISAADCKVDGRTPADELSARGYEFLRSWAPGKDSDKSHECIYIQRNYLKFGKTGYQGGIIFPKMESLGEGVSGLKLAFDWYTQRQGSGVMDPTELVVIVSTGDDVQVFSVPKLGLPDGSVAKWVRAEIDFGDLSLTQDTRITIRNADEQLKSAKALRWHLDNVRLSKPAE
ncbi:MAG: BACON domain-containing protein [Muribaculaceae bacterium]|nr:BACON domain-containing protein [Muribaculaceae bacterium]